MSVNKVILVGNLTRDPELKYTPSGAAVVNFSIATSEKYKDRDGNKQEKTEYHNLVAWRQLAEIIGKYCVKGKQVYIEGKLQTRKYQDRDGNDKYTTEIVADQLQMLGSKSGNSSQQPSQQYAQPQPQRQPAQNNASQPQPQQQPAPAQQQQGAVYQEPAFNPDDEIPF